MKVLVTKTAIMTVILFAVVSVMPAWGGVLGGVENQVLSLVNQERGKSGLPALALDGRLRALAEAHSEDMLSRNFFSHSNPDGISFQERIARGYGGPFSQAAENIWTGSGYDTASSQRLARKIVDSWLASPGHRANMLSSAYIHTGVGVAARGGEIRATQLFMRR